MLPCKACAYQAEAPGSCHYECRFAWSKAVDLVAVGVRANQFNIRKWYLFPINFDPTWGPDTCPARAESAVEGMRRGSPDVLALVGLLTDMGVRT